MSLFGNTQQNKPAGGGLFGSSTAQNTSGGGLFGSNTNTATNAPIGGGGLLGSSTAQQQPSTGGGLFGSNTNQQNTGNTGNTGLFGSSTAQANTGGGGLFGASNNNQQQQSQQQQSSGGGLFGSNTNANASTTGGSLFGQQNTQPAQTTSLFGSTAQPQQSSLFGGSTAQPQQPSQPTQTTSFTPATVSVGNMGHTMTPAQLQKLQFSGMSTVPNEKTVADQIRTIIGKWSPDSDSTILKTYLYNAVPKEYAPFFYPNAAAGEDEKSWEEALSRKPEPPKVDGKEVDTLAYVPILVRGFKALGERANTQAMIVQQMRARLHEMNNSLTTIMDAHEQRITVTIARAKRQHQILQQKCLRLSVKVQVLRNRGYALDAAEEGLRKTLMALEKQVMDPSFVGREDEIWARMIALKERARWLEEEGKLVNAQVLQQQQQQGSGASSALPEDVLATTRKILKDYDGQLQHLNREFEDVKKEFEDWEQSRKP